MTTLHTIPIEKLPIRLGQFLKLADLVQDGLEAKILIQQGKIFVNDEVELRRGRQLGAGDIVQFQKERLQLIKKQ